MIFIIRILNFVTNPKNRNLLFIIGIVLLIIFTLRQCNKINNLKNEVEEQKKETIRVSNNYKASQAEIIQQYNEKNTLIAKTLGYSLKVSELEKEYSDLFTKYTKEKNKKPITIIETDYTIVFDTIETPIYIDYTDSTTKLTLTDSIYYGNNNFLSYNGNINLYSFNDSIKKAKGNLSFTMGMNLNLTISEDEETNMIYVTANTDYPNVKFTKITGASIISDNVCKPKIKDRKRFSFGINGGYGVMYVPRQNNFVNGFYIGAGLNIQPKFLQW